MDAQPPTRATHDTPDTPVAEAPGTGPGPLTATQEGTRESARPRVLVSRRTVLVAGTGLAALGGTGLVATHLGILTSIEKRILAHRGITLLPAPDPQPLPDGPLSTPQDIVIFDGALASGWSDRSWAYHKLDDPTASFQGKPGMTMLVANWGGLQFISKAFDTAGLGYVQCQVRGKDKGGQVAYLTLVTADGTETHGVSLGNYTQGGSIAAGEWRLARVPLSALNGVNALISGLVLRSGAIQPQGTIELADLRIVYHPDLRPPTAPHAWAWDLATITLAFDEPMDPVGAANLTNYLVAAAAGTSDPAYPPAHPLAPVQARYHPNARTVSLVVPRPLRPGGVYTVTFGGIKDRFGVSATPGTQARIQVTAQPLTVALDPAAQRHPISREIYGMANVSADVAHDLGVTLMRWGGNPTTRYNWKLGNAFNAGRDYYFKNGNYGKSLPADRRPSALVDQFVATNSTRGITSFVTIPTIGWVARNDNSAIASLNVPSHGGPPLTPGGEAIQGYDPAANRQRTSVPSRARKGAPFSDPPDLRDPTVAQDEWVYHLTRRFGSASSGGVRYYAMDNEPDLWSYTHTDVRPAQLGYDQLRDIFLEYATAVKDVDPSAQITGPVSWGWTGYFYSPLDAGHDNYHTHADQAAHGGVPLLVWWLDQIRSHDQAAGRRTLDVLDLHFYPQGGEYSDNAAPKMSARRLRSTRALWDPAYVDESWIGKPVQLIPRMRKLVQTHYPGTKLALSEWSWGAEGTVNGALALAEALGIFGREGLDIACHWAGLQPQWPAYSAFKLFGNYDGAGSAFGDTSFSAQSTNTTMLSCYAAQASESGALLLMILNTSVDSDLTPTLRLDNVGAAFGGAAPRRARVWRFWPGDAAGITPGPDLDLSDAPSAPLTLTYTFPASSITLLRVEAGA